MAYIIVLLGSCLSLAGQSLIPNGSFERYSSCPSGGWAQPTNVHVDLLDQWTGANAASPDFFHTCANGSNPATGVPVNWAGRQLPRSGEGCTGFFAWDGYVFGASNYREYLQATLSTPLRAGRRYQLTFYVSLWDSGYTEALGLGNIVATDDVGASFSQGLLEEVSVNVLNVPFHVRNPEGDFLTDLEDWMQITGVYTARGGEDHVTIGNFLDAVSSDTQMVVSRGARDRASAYYYLDDVSLLRLRPDLGPDRALCPGDIVLLDPGMEGQAYAWSTGDSTRQINATPPGEYICGVLGDSGWVYDTLLINLKNATPEPQIPNVFTPNGDSYNELFQPTFAGAWYHLWIYDRWGKLLYEGRNGAWDGMYRGKILDSGVFYWVMKWEACGGEQGGKAGPLTLIK